MTGPPNDPFCNSVPLVGIWQVFGDTSLEGGVYYDYHDLLQRSNCTHAKAATHTNAWRKLNNTQAPVERGGSSGYGCSNPCHWHVLRNTTSSTQVRLRLNSLVFSDDPDSTAQPHRSLRLRQSRRSPHTGTFLVHKGPICFGLQDLPHTSGDGLVSELAQRTFNPASKSQRAKAKTYLSVLGEMYKKGEATLQVLGLQRVGFNAKFYEILRRAYNKRGKMRARARSETARSASPGQMTLLELFGPGSSGKRARAEETEEWGEGEGGGSGAKRPSKARKYLELDF
ncbi:hypothetical protein FKP32DRAFT_1682972 [Trametes sanguinea]|nr:hypothetical protein FKP32DRAFT_1682972 [Trametes sanguinea]